MESFQDKINFIWNNAEKLRGAYKKNNMVIYAICKEDILIKGQNANHIAHGIHYL